MSSTMVWASPHCKTTAEFNAAFDSELGHQSLQDLFEDSNNKLGQGNFGMVKSIPWILKSGEQIQVAVKKVDLKRESDVEQVDNEIDNLVQLKGNENVLQIYGCMEITVQIKNFKILLGKFHTVIEDKKQVYIVLEKLYGDFEDSYKPESPFMKFKALPLVKKMELSLQLAEGLKSMHDKGLVHADLKPANMMAADQNLSNLKIIDLGLGAKIGSPFVTSTILYLDIDVLDTEVLQKTFDTNSFGLTIAGMAFGTNSFKGSSLAFWNSDRKKFGEIRKENVKNLLYNEALEWGRQVESLIDDSFIKIIMSCIDLDLAKRPSDEELIQRLKDVIEETKRIAVVREQKRGGPLAFTLKVDNNNGSAEVSNSIRGILVANTQPVDIKTGSADVSNSQKSQRVFADGSDDKKTSLFIYVLIGVVLLGLLVPLGYFLCFKRQPHTVGMA